MFVKTELENFKIYSLLVVKDEADIITSSLIEAAKWSDKVIVLDNGSEDGTWEIINQLSLLHPNIIPFAQEPGPFHIGLRARMFDAFKHELSDNDWWCIRLDADEFYIDNPREFLKSIPKHYRLVWKESYDYKITYEDLNEFTFGQTFEENKSKIAYYEPYTWSEGRFMRHSNKLTWGDKEKSPKRRGLSFPKQIKVAHYQYRSPEQMQVRFQVRQKAKYDGCGTFKHEKGETWKDYLSHRTELIHDQRDGLYPSYGPRNKHNRFWTRLSKWVLTAFCYY